MSKHIVMIIANSSNPSYFRWFAELNSVENEFKLSYIYLNTSKPSIADELNQYNVNSYWFYFDYSKNKYFQYIKILFKLFFLFLKIKPDVVQTNLFDDSLPGLLAARLNRIKKRIITKQDTGFHIRYSPKWIIFDKLNNFNATDIVVVSQETHELVNKFEKPNISKIKLIHHGVDQNFFSKKSDKYITEFKNKYNLNGKIVIGTIARYIELKGYKNIIEAAKLINEKRNDIVFVGVGWGDLKDELEELIKKYNLEGKVILTGKIEYEKIPSIFKCFDIFLHAAIYEPFGFVIAEAMFAKIPIISTSVGASRDALVHKESGYIINFNDPDDIVKGIDFMLSNDSMEIANKAYELAKLNFAKNIMWTNYKNVFLSH